jgi:hypothetical protein
MSYNHLFKGEKMFKLYITDEFGVKFFVSEFDNYKSALKEIQKWLEYNDSGETPIYNIDLEVSTN